MARSTQTKLPIELKSFAIERYRSFANREEIELRPLTLFYGFNSVGKSALLRTLPLLAASSTGLSTTPLDLEAPIGRGASFENIVSRHQEAPAVQFHLNWTETQDDSIRFEIRAIPERRTQIINRLQIVSGDEEFELLWEPELFAEVTTDRYSVRSTRTPITTTATLQFKGLCPMTWSTSLRTLETALESVRQRMLTLSATVHWLGALRTLVPRREAYVAKPISLGSRGAKTGQALAYDQLVNGPLRASVSQWYEKATENTLVVEESTASQTPLFSLKLVPSQKSPVRVDIADTGEGMGQVLPALTLASMAALGHLGAAPIVAIEHPELHLQPAVHPALAEHFISSIRNSYDPKFLIETHSENFLLRLQLGILHKELSPSDLIVYWITQDPSGASTIEAIEFDGDARPARNNWPTEAFSQSLEQARSILKARNRDKQ